MNVTVPVPHELLARIPLFVTINPLKRPKVNYFNKSMRQPLENQKELRLAVKDFAHVHIDVPCFTQVFVNWVPPDLKRKSNLTVHPTKLYHGDLDNLDKAVNDALVEASIISDDKLIVGTLKTKAYGAEDLACVAIFSVKHQISTLEDVWGSYFDPTSYKPFRPQ